MYRPFTVDVSLCWDDLFIQVVSDKRLVKPSQKELARLEAELRSPDPASSPSFRSLLMEKDQKIQQVNLFCY